MIAITKSFLMIILVFPGMVNAAELTSATLKAWEEYAESANIRMLRRLGPGQVLLWVDEDPARLASVREGEIVIAPVGHQNPERVPSGLIHDWVGATFIPDATIKDVFEVTRDYGRFKDWYRPAVIDSKVIATSDAKDRYSMLLINKSFFLKTALDTDYESCYVRLDDRRGYSITRTTRIQEVQEYGFPAQRILNEDEGHGILWRLLSFTRYTNATGVFTSN
jgi:hypothetical protein